MTDRTSRTTAIRQSEARTLDAIAEALHTAPDVRQALERTLALVAERLGLPTGWVWLLDPETQQFYSAAVHNLPPYLQEPVRMTGRACWCIERFREGRLNPANIDVMSCSRLHQAEEEQAQEATGGLRSHASIPLYFQEQPLGIMNLSGPEGRELTQEELRLLSTIAYQVGLAVERARLADESARLARAEERARLAREIHDTLAQGLTGIALHIESALPHLGRDPDRARERLERALSQTRESLEEARRSVENLRALPLAGKPLAEALGALARNFTSETGIRTLVALKGQGALPLKVEAELFRIAQEGMANVRRHAAATEVLLFLRLEPNAVRLTLRDNGQGFAPGSVGAPCRGVLGIRERVNLLGGHLRLVSKVGRGTTLQVTAPLLAGEGE